MPRRAERDLFEIKGTASTSIPAAQVIERITTPETWPEWQMEILSTEGPQRLNKGDVVKGNASMLGFHVEGQSVSCEVSDSIFEEQVVVGVGMRVRYEVREEGGRTMITHSLSSELPGGPMGRVLSFFLRRRLRVMQSVLLERLAQADSPD
jgi:hypothetical protein